MQLFFWIRVFGMDARNIVRCPQPGKNFGKLKLRGIVREIGKLAAIIKKYIGKYSDYGNTMSQKI